MVSGLFDCFVGIRIKVRTVHSAISGTWDDVPQMPDHRIDHEQLAMLVPVVSPRVYRPFADDFELARNGVKSPHATVECGSLRVGCTWRAHERGA